MHRPDLLRGSHHLELTRSPAQPFLIDGGWLEVGLRAVSETRLEMLRVVAGLDLGEGRGAQQVA